MTPLSSSSPSSFEERNEILGNSLSRRHSATCVEKLARFAARSLGIGALAFGSFVGLSDFSHGIEHHVISSSAPHRTIGCENGNCRPISKTFGYVQPSWRPWPNAQGYSGIKKPMPNVDIPAAKIPEAREELRFEKRTRSDRPLDPDPNELPPDIVPGAGSELDPNNPFQVVPDSDLPDPADATEPALPTTDAGGGGTPEPIEPLPSNTPDNSTTDMFGLPETNPAPSNAPGGEFETPPPNNDTSPLPDLDSQPEDLPPDGNNDIFDPFDLGTGLRNDEGSPRVADDVEDLELIRREMARRSMVAAPRSDDRTMKDQILDQLAVEPIPQVTGTATDLPKFEVVGNFTGEFAASDLLAQPRTDRRVAPASMEQVATKPAATQSRQYAKDHELLRRQIQELRDQLQESGISPTGATGQPGAAIQSRSATATQRPVIKSQQSRRGPGVNHTSLQKARPAKPSGIVYEDTGNPLRPRRRVFGNAPVMQTLPSRNVPATKNGQQRLAAKNKTVQRQPGDSNLAPSPSGTVQKPIPPVEAKAKSARAYSTVKKPAANTVIRTSTTSRSVPSILQTKRREQQRQRNIAAARAAATQAQTKHSQKQRQLEQPKRVTSKSTQPSVRQTSTVKIRTAPATPNKSEAEVKAKEATNPEKRQALELVKHKVDPKRNIAAANRRSLRDTLRKNPLRR